MTERCALVWGRERGANEEDGAVVRDDKGGGGHCGDGGGGLVGQAKCHEIAHGVPGRVCVRRRLGACGQEALLEEREEEVPLRVGSEHLECARGVALEGGEERDRA